MKPEWVSNESFVRRDESSARLKKIAVVLVAKAVCDFVFVLALVIMFFFSAFDRGVEAMIEIADGRQVGGHILNTNGEPPPEVQLYINGDFVQSSRPQCEAEVADHTAARRCEFRFNLPGLKRGDYEAQIFASGAKMDRTLPTLQNFGATQRFTVAGIGR